MKNKRKSIKIGKRQKKQLAIVTVVILIASIVAIMLLTPMFDVKTIKVKGNSVIQSQEVVGASGIALGVNIFEVNLDKAKKNVRSIGYVEDVKIKRRLPSTIEITVVEEVGVAYIKAEEGYVIITASGRCIDVSDGRKENKKGEKDSVALPELAHITGLTKVKYKVGETITAENPDQLKVLFSCLHEFSKQGYVFDMVEIDMSDMNKIEFYYKTRNLRVSVGDASKIEYKMECFGPILEEIGADAQGYIDLERLTYRKPEVKAETEKEQ